MEETKTLICGVSDKVLMPWLQGKEYMDCSDEGEAVAIAGGYWLSTGRRATAFMSADGFFNALNILTSWIIPECIEVDIVISIGRTEPHHYLATNTIETIINLVKLHTHETGLSERVSFEFIRK